MDFRFTEFQQALRQNVRQMMKGFPAQYWRDCDRDHRFPAEFFATCAEAGYLGMIIPEEYGGLNLGCMEVCLVLQEMAEQGAGTTGCAAVHGSMFSIHPVVHRGSKATKEKYLPLIAQGKMKVSIGMTEPDAGQDILNIRTFAEKRGDRYIINGHKIFISGAQGAQKVLLLTRTTPLDKVAKRTDGLTVFFADIDRKHMEIREIEKLGRAGVDSNEIWIEGLEVPEEDVVGEVGKGFRVIFEATNPERILVAAEAIGIGLCALNKAVQYAKERVVFGNPIGKYQGIQHPLADSYAKLRAAEQIMYKAAWLYDNGLPCGEEANICKLLGSKFACEAVDRGMVTMGGYSFAKEYDIERWFRELQQYKIAPLPEQMVYNSLAEHVLGLPRSY